MIPVEAQIKSFLDFQTRWQNDKWTFLYSTAPKIALALLEALILIQLLHLLTRRLLAFSKREDLPTGIRAQQLRTLASVMNGIGMFVIVFVAAMQILPLLGLDIRPLLASAGVAGLAIGFGAQTLVKDVINGFFILMENQYDIGDDVKIGGVSGAVEQLTLRRTVLRDADGSLHNIPNSEIKIVSNLTRDWTQTKLHVAVSYQEDSDRIIGLLREVGEELHNDPAFADMMVAAPEVPGIERITGSEVDYLVLVKTRPGKHYPVTRELRLRIKACFEKNQVQTAAPTAMYLMK